MNKKAFYLNIYQALFILVVSWLYTFSTYHISFEILLCFYNILIINKLICKSNLLIITSVD
nr:MAG TPA: protein of unknown function DUF547 [Bacteriophage sp.]